MGPAWLQVVLSRLYHPTGFAQPSWEFAWPGLEGGSNDCGSGAPVIGLRMPDEVFTCRVLCEVLRPKVLTTPDSVGLPFGTPLLGDLASGVLGPIAPQVVAAMAATIALRRKWARYGTLA